MAQAPPVSPSLSPTRTRCLNIVLCLLPFLVTFAHVFLSPYTKVEESFTLHAVHDVLAYGFNPHNLQLVSPGRTLQPNQLIDANSGIMSPSLALSLAPLFPRRSWAF